MLSVPVLCPQFQFPVVLDRQYKLSYQILDQILEIIFWSPSYLRHWLAFWILDVDLLLKHGMWSREASEHQCVARDSLPCPAVKQQLICHDGMISSPFCWHSVSSQKWLSTHSSLIFNIFSIRLNVGFLPIWDIGYEEAWAQDCMPGSMFCYNYLVYFPWCFLSLGDMGPYNVHSFRICLVYRR